MLFKVKQNDVLWVFRKSNLHFNSIENVFTSIYPFVVEYFQIKSIHLPFKRITLTNVLRNIFFAKKATRNLIHITGDINYILPFLRGKKILTIHDCHSLLVGSNFSRWIKKLFWLKYPIRDADTVHCVSQKTRQEITELYPKWSHKYHVIPNSVHHDFFTFPSTPKKLRQVLLLGTKTNKNIGRCLSALEGIDANIIIVGKDTKELNQHSNQEYIRLDNVSQNKLIKLLAESTVLLFPSTYEGFGLPIIEAQALGTCVISSNIAPMEQVSGDGAIKVDPFKVNEIKKAVLNLLDKPELQAQLIEKGKINATNYHPEVIAQAYCLMYESVINA